MGSWVSFVFGLALRPPYLSSNPTPVYPTTPTSPQSALLPLIAPDAGPGTAELRYDDVRGVPKPRTVGIMIIMSRIPSSTPTSPSLVHCPLSAFLSFLPYPVPILTSGLPVYSGGC